MIKLIHGETIEEMKKLPDSSVDMILADLPYGTTANKWDAVIPFDKLWEQYKRIIKEHGAIVLFGQEPFSSTLRLSNSKMYRYDWYWDKMRGANPFLARKQPMRNIETISVFYKKLPTYNPQMTANPNPESNYRIRYNPAPRSDNYHQSTGFKYHLDHNPNLLFPLQTIKISNRGKEVASGKRVHPTQKPVELLEYLIKTYTNPNDLVLDNTMGSGSTGVACVNLDRDFIGIELDEKYFNIATQRINEAKGN